MTVDIYAKLRLPSELSTAWHASILLAQEERLCELAEYGAIDMGDDDLLGSLITVEEQTSLEEALEYLDSIGLTVPRARISHWVQVESDSGPAIRFVLAGPLARDATVADLLRYLELSAGAGQEFFRVDICAEADASEVEVVVHGTFSTYDAYRDYRLPLLYAAAAAGTVGGTGQLNFGGDDDGEFVALFVDIDSEHISINEPDPQNITEADWMERLGGYNANAVEYEAWLNEHRV